MTLCKTLFNQEQEWRKHSVYPLRDDSDRDFEFYVFVDAGNEEKRPPFLQEVHHVLMGKQGFAVQSHEKELKRWLGEKAPSDMINPLNWIKIAIERYPYRLFVVIDPEAWKENDKSPLDEEFWCGNQADGASPEEANSRSEGNEKCIASPEDKRTRRRPEFLYKRICWVGREDFEKAVRVASPQGSTNEGAFPDIADQFHEEPGEYLQLWLHLKWIQHIAVRVRGVDKNLCLYFGGLQHTPTAEEQDPPYNPSTLPLCLRTPKTQCVVSPRFYMQVWGVLQLGSNAQGSSDYLYIVFARHANHFRLGSAGWYDFIRTEYFDEIGSVYGEFLSGNLGYLSEIFRSVEKKGIESYRVFLSLVEQALVRTVLIDERVQEHYGRLTEEQAGFIVQQRVFVAYLDAPEKYAQLPKPAHGIYAKVSADDVSRLTLYFPQGKDFEQIFSSDKLGVDMVIVHQGILDKWEQDARRDEKSGSMQERVLKWKDRVPFLVVTSGRGTPPNLPRGVKFLPFSGLEACVRGPLFEKLSLAKQIFALKSVEV